MTEPVTSRDDLTPGGVEWATASRRWARGWWRVVFPGIFLIYLAQTAAAVSLYSTGPAAVAGYVILAAFCCCYVAALPARWEGRSRRFWTLYVMTIVLMVVELPFAHQDAFVMGVFVSVLTIATFGRAAVPVTLVLAGAAVLVPAAIPSWNTGFDIGAGFSILLVSLAMSAFFGLIRANQALSEARSEVARLAAENERTRIARDLHDLLGHSLTTITVKAGLAHRLSELDPARAAQEMAEVEGLARSSLADVRAAIEGYREVTLAGELATGRELLGAAGISAELPSTPEVVEPRWQELFGWVLREALTNVVRHSRATRCTVSLCARGIEIVDDGPGPPRPGTETGGHGLTGLRERVEAAGAVLETGPAQPAGWRVAVDASNQPHSFRAAPAAHTAPDHAALPDHAAPPDHAAAPEHAAAPAGRTVPT